MDTYRVSSSVADNCQNELIKAINQTSNELKLVCANQDKHISLMNVQRKEFVSGLEYSLNEGVKINMLFYASPELLKETEQKNSFKRLIRYPNFEARLLAINPKRCYLISDRRMVIAEEDMPYADLNVFKNPKISEEWLIQFDKMKSFAKPYIKK